MACLGCGAEKTIRAHLIPQAFVREVRGKDKAHALTNRNISSCEASQNGRFDDAILCAKCDNDLGKDEKYAFETLSAIRRAVPHIVDRFFELDGINGDRLFRFAAGTVWKYTQTRSHYGRISIGPYEAQLRQFLFEAAEPPRSINAFLMKLHSGDDQAFYYRAPHPTRYGGINFVSFSVGGFLVRLKIDKRDADLPNSAWLRGNSSIIIPAIRFDQIEEGRMVLGARKANAKLDAYLEKVSLNPTLQ